MCAHASLRSMKGWREGARFKLKEKSGMVVVIQESQDFRYEGYHHVVYPQDDSYRGDDLSARLDTEGDSNL